MTRGHALNSARLLLIALILVLGAFWVGARYGTRQADNVEARHNVEPAPVLSTAAAAPAQRTPLTEEESINVRIYR